MGDHRAGPSGTATAVGAPTPGKRVARHSAEQRTSQPYVGRRVSGRDPVVPPPAPTESEPETVRLVGRRIAIDVDCPGDSDDVAGHLFRPTAAPTLTPYVGRRVATTVRLITEPEPVEPVVETVPEPVVEAVPEPVVETVVEPEPVVETVPEPDPEPVVEPVVETVEAPALLTEPELTVTPEKRPDAVRTSKRTRPSGRRVATRRARVPSLPLLAGVAVLAISAGGALQAMHPGLAGTDADGHLSPAGALSGSSAVSSANVLGGRGTVVSRDSDRQAASGAGSLQAAADAQAKQRDQTLSEFAAKAEKRSAQVKLHQWVLPVTPGVYHLTARFGDYSSLWSHFHTGLDFAAPTGTPIMAVAGGKITEVGYSGAYGNRTIELLPDGTELWYCHQNEFGTSVGATVKPGQVIGYVGSTGNVTGPHLHLEVHPGGGDPVDPYTALQVHGLNP